MQEFIKINRDSSIIPTPAVGAFSDILISKGGTTILTEVPEMFGAETILMNRCRDEETFQMCIRDRDRDDSAGVGGTVFYSGYISRIIEGESC